MLYFFDEFLMNQLKGMNDMTVKNKPPFRYDIVGSFLRPAALKEKRDEFASGKITAEELKAAEDAAIADLVSKEKKQGSTLSPTENSAAGTGIWTF